MGQVSQSAVIGTLFGIARKGLQDLEHEGFYAFPVNRAELEFGSERVVPADHPVRGLGQHGVYIYFNNERCLYVGKASDQTLVGRALDYLFADGGQAEAYRVVRERATSLLIKGTADEAEARRAELAAIVALQPVLNEGFIYASAAEKKDYGLSDAAANAGSAEGQVSPVAQPCKIHVEIWLAAASLYESGQTAFSPAQLAQEVKRLFDDTRPGVMTHIAAHCNASAPKNNSTVYNYLVRTGVGHYKLYAPGDQIHPTRTGAPYFPDQADVPAECWSLWRRQIRPEEEE